MTSMGWGRRTGTRAAICLLGWAGLVLALGCGSVKATGDAAGGGNSGTGGTSGAAGAAGVSGSAGTTGTAGVGGASGATGSGGTTGTAGTGGGGTGTAGSAGGGGAGGASSGGADGGVDAGLTPCEQATTQAACALLDHCHPVFADPHNCACLALGCCARFSSCAPGRFADCAGPALCKVATPFCEDPYVVGYRGTCYEGCVRLTDCAK